MLTVACVLRSGGIYDASWVAKLSAGVKRNLGFAHRFVCLTDMVGDVEEIGVEAVPLEHGWPGWWSKIEIFRTGLFDGPVLYLDLDTVIVNSINHLPVHNGFTAVREYSTAGGICSTAMAWGSDLSGIYTRFWRDPEKYMELHDQLRPQGRIGDQAFICDTIARQHIKVWPRLWVASFKHHCRKALPRQACAVAFHGTPKPPDVVDRIEWVANHWRE